MFLAGKCICALLAPLAVVLATAAPAHSAAWTCESSAVRGAVLGAPVIEPLTANRGQAACLPAKATLSGATGGLPLALSIHALDAETTVLDGDKPLAQQKVGAFGGIADLRIHTLPDLPLQVPLPDLSSVPAVELPLVGTIDLKPAVAALLPDGRLPSLDLVRVQALAAYAGGQCTNGVPELLGSSRVAGLTVLGQELPLNEVVERTLTVFDGQTIDPSQADLETLPLPTGVVLDPVLRSTLQGVLDSIPDIPIPATLAQVKVTPAQQFREGGRLIQRALQVHVSLLGSTLADLVIGEASVGAQDIDCAPATPAQAAALECTTRKLVLADVLPEDRVRLVGYADKSLAGRTVNISLSSTGDRVARAVVRPDGSFRTTAPLPPEGIREGDLARYQATVGEEKSMRLKLHRRMVVDNVRPQGDKVRVSGRVLKPLATPRRAIEVRRRVSCNQWKVVRRIHPDRNGRFRVTLDGPPGALAATYRFATRVPSSAGGKSRKTFETFTLPIFVDFKE